MTLLRESFATVGARFHLVGLYALAALLVRFAEHWTGDDPSGLLLILGSLLLYIAADCGIFGVLYQAAEARREPIHFLRWTSALFLPVFWLLFKIGLVQAWLIALAATLRQAIAGGDLTVSLEAVVYWGRPFFDLATQVLALYSLPLCILSRVRREWRPHIRQGFGTYRARPSESRRLVLLLLLVTGLDAALHFWLGPGSEKAAPGYAEGVVLLASSYLSLAAFFGATRVVLARFPDGAPEALAGGGPSAPGPAA